MNQLYRVLWNTARQQYVVTSELARGRGKSSSTSTAGATASLSTTSGAVRTGLSALSRALVIVGLCAPGLVLASTCATGTGTESAPAGGACTIGDYDTPINQNGVGGAVITAGDNVTLRGMGNYGSGYTGNTTVPASSLTAVSGSFNSNELVIGSQTTAVAQRNAATGTNVIYQTFDSRAFADRSNADKTFNQFSDVNGDQYINASFGKVEASGGTLNVNLGNTPTAAPSSNSIMMTAKQTYLTSADGTGSASSTVNWQSRNAINLGIDPGLPTPDVNGNLLVEIPVTTYAGTVAFNGTNYVVNNASQLAAYNDVLVAALRNGQLTSQQAYNDAFNSAFSTRLEAVTYATNTTAGDFTRIPNGDRYAILAQGARASATIGTGAQIDIERASGAVKATNGALVTNNGTLSGNVITQVAQIESGSRFVNSASGVVSSGYLAGDKLNTATATPFYYTGSGVMATGAGTTVQNSGVINTAGFGYLYNTSTGLGLANGASGNNNGNINVGVNPDYVTDVIGVNVSGGSSFVNAADGTIYIGRAAQYSLSDPSVEVSTFAPTYGVRIMDTGDSAINAGQITIGSKTQNAVAMYSTAPQQSLLLNSGTIDINGAAGGTPLANIGILADDNGAAGTGAIARNAGTINVNGINGVGIKVNANPNAQANAESTGTINVNGTADPASGTRNFGVWVDGAGAVANVSGGLNLVGKGAIGAFAQDGGTINIANGAEPKFLSSSDQIGAYASGAGSTINVAANALDVSTARSTMFRVADGATFNGAASSLTVSGEDARGVVGTGLGTTVSTGASAYTVTGVTGANGGPVAIAIEGGANGTIEAASSVRLNSTGAIAGIVDGQAFDITGAAVGMPLSTTLTNNAVIQSSTPGTTGFIARNRGTLVNNNTVALTGAGSTGVIVGSEGTVRNTGTISVANGNGALVQGARANLINDGTIQAADGIAAVHLTGPGASVAFSGAGLIDAGGTADGILIDSTAVGGSVTGTAGNIVINGTGIALNNQAAGATINVTNTTVTANGAGAAGISSLGANGNIDITGGTINATGANGVGVLVGSAGTLTMSNASINTSGNFSRGVVLDSGATASLMGGEVTSNGTGSSALFVTGPTGAATVTGTSLTSSAGVGATSNAGGAIALNGTRINAASSAVAITDTVGSGNLATVSVNGGTLNAQAGNAIDVNGARANIDISNGAQLTASTGTLLNFSNGAQANVNVDNTQLVGNLIADASSTGVVNLRRGTSLTGFIDPVSLNIDNTSSWNVTASSLLDNLSNAGTVAFVAPSANPALASSYKTITATNYVGNNGTIALNTFLGTDNSPTDRLIINGGTATGSTGLKVNNTGGMGGLTTGNGINVVQTTNGGTTAANAFRLAAPVQAGAYEYLLYRGGSDSADNYYLRSSLGDATTPGGGTSPSAPVAYRPGVAGYVMTPTLNLDYGFANLGRLQERVGDIASTELKQKGNTDGVWGRIGGSGLQADAGRFSVHQQTFFMQFGKDWTLAQSPDGGSTHAGVTASLSTSDAKFRDDLRNLNMNLSNNVGKVNTQAQSLGGYYTKYAKDGSYWDSVAQVTHYRNKYSDVYGGGDTQNGAGIALSQEVGKPFALGSTMAIEPQAQLVYQYLKLSRFNDGVSDVSGASDNALRGRLGVRLFAPSLDNTDRTGAGTPYVTLDVLHDFVSPRSVRVDGANISPDFGRTWGEVGVGISSSIGKGGQLYAVTKLSKNLGGEDRRGVFGQVGYRYSW